MKPLLILFFAVLCFPASSQYLWFQSRIECAAGSEGVIKKTENELTTALDHMVRENKLYNYDKELIETKEKPGISIYFLAEDNAKFEVIKNEWLKRTGTASFKAFWQACPTRKDTLFNSTKVMYPLIKNVNSPVAYVPVIDEYPDPKVDYNIVVDFVSYQKMKEKKDKLDSSKVNWGLPEVGRIFNLHVAAGIPKEKINIVLAVHGFAMDSFMNNEAYQKKFKMDNPNMSILKELSGAGVKFLMCGQSATWFGFKKEMLIPEAKMTLTAQTTLSSYQGKGYALKTMRND